MERRDTVAPATRLDGENRHRKRFAAIVRVAAPQAAKLFVRDAGLRAVIGKVVVQQPGVEQVDTGGHRGMRRENVVGADGFYGFVKGQAVFRHLEPDAFDAEEGRMALVHMEHRRGQTQRREYAHAANAEDNLLADAGVGVAAVELIGNVPVLRRRVLRDVGVEQIELDAANTDHPRLDEDFPGRHLNGDDQIRAVGPVDGLNRQGIEIVLRRLLNLPAVLVQRLAQVALLVEQSDANEGQIEVRGGFQVIARQHPQAARVNRQALGQAVLHRKIGDQLLGLGRRRSVHVGIEPFARFLI